MNKKNEQIKQNYICFVTGKSGGHLIPSITLAKKFIEQANNSGKNLKIMFFSTDSAMDKKILQNNPYVHEHVMLKLENIPYKKLIKYPIFLINLAGSFFKSLAKFISKRPEKVISLGGYISIPVCLAAFTLRIPIELFELNTSPGKAIKFLAPFATTINICFQKAASALPVKKCKLESYPVRFEPQDVLLEPEKKLEIVKKYGLLPGKTTLLILGGSQGSLSINNLLKEIVLANRHWAQKTQIIHQTGDKDSSGVGQTYKDLGFTCHVFPFDNNVRDYYNISDIVICRSGAGSSFETLYFKKKCFTIPLESATTDHQVDNALEMEKIYPNLFKMVRQSSSFEVLTGELKKIIEN